MLLNVFAAPAPYRTRPALRRSPFHFHVPEELTAAHPIVLASQEKYLRPKDRHVLSAAQEQACNDRLYLKGKDRFPQVRQQLWNKYLAPMETPSKVLPPTDVQVMVQRLYPKP